MMERHRKEAKMEIAKWTKEIREEERRQRLVTKAIEKTPNVSYEKRQKLVEKGIEKAVNQEKGRLVRNEKARERRRQKKAKEEVGWKGSDEFRKLRTNLENSLRKVWKREKNDRKDFQAVLTQGVFNNKGTKYLIEGNSLYGPKESLAAAKQEVLRLLFSHKLPVKFYMNFSLMNYEC